jgi:hypothetical protein
MTRVEAHEYLHDEINVDRLTQPKRANEQTQYPKYYMRMSLLLHHSTSAHEAQSRHDGARRQV